MENLVVHIYLPKLYLSIIFILVDFLCRAANLSHWNVFEQQSTKVYYHQSFVWYSEHNILGSSNVCLLQEDHTALSPQYPIKSCFNPLVQILKKMLELYMVGLWWAQTTYTVHSIGCSSVSHVSSPAIRVHYSYHRLWIVCDASTNKCCSQVLLIGLGENVLDSKKVIASVI